MGKAMWEFISTIYKLHWDNFFMDNNKLTFRSKVKLKFNPQAPSKGKETIKPTFVSTFPPPILA